MICFADNKSVLFIIKVVGGMTIGSFDGALYTPKKIENISDDMIGRQHRCAIDNKGVGRWDN